MKTLEELDINPAPWHMYYTHFPKRLFIGDSGEGIVCSPARAANARLIAAAPELYECLRDVAERYCKVCREANITQGLMCSTEDEPRCPLRNRWLAALSKAGGEG